MEMKSVLIVTEFEHAAHMLEKTLNNVFKGALNFSSTTIRSIDSLTVVPNAIVMDLSNHYSLIRDKGISNIELFDLKYTLTLNGYEELMRLKDGTEAFVFNINDKETDNTINLIHELGINNLVLKPLLENSEFNLSKDILITPNEASRLNVKFKNIINIDDRKIDPLFLFNIAKRMSVLNEVVSSRIYSCLQNSIPKIPGIINNSFKNSLINSHDFNDFSSGVLKYINGYIVFANTSALLFFGIKEQDLIGQRPEKILNSNAFFKSGKFITNINGRNFYIQNHVNNDVERTGIVEILDEVQINKFNTILTRGNDKTKKRTKYEFSHIIGENDSIKKAVNLAKVFSKTNQHILIEGESGTGKELFAQSIHNSSNLAKQPFIAFNCAALQENLAESELFGYEGGAFTGANRNGKIGLVEAANGGTLFLDEIGELHSSVQSKLLRMIQEQEILRVGSTEPIPIDIRFIAATNKSLLKMVEEGTFRQDLYYRLNTLYLKIPPLRERQGDIELIINSILSKQKKTIIFSDNLKKIVGCYTWPGNIRELRNFLNYLVSIYESDLSKSDKSYYAEHFFYREDSMISIESDQNLNHTSNLCDLDFKVMEVIYEKTVQHLSIGRNGIYSLLKDKVPNITESNLRKCLNVIEQEGYLLKGKGRAGSRLNHNGIKFIESYLGM